MRFGPPSMPSRAVSVYTTRLTPCSARILEKWMALICERCCQPCVATMPSVAVEAHDQALAERLEGVVEQVERRHGGRAHDHPVDADARDQGKVLGAADAAAVLHGDVEGLDDALQDVEVHELAGARGVEVDDVEGLRALVLPVTARGRPGRRRRR